MKTKWFRRSPLDAEKIPAVVLLSTEITVERVVRWVRRLAGGKISLMVDNDDHRRERARSTLWKLAHTPATVIVYRAAQMEDLSAAEREAVHQALLNKVGVDRAGKQREPRQ